MHRYTLLASSTVIMLSVVVGTTSAALVNNGGGLIYDSDLNITWLQNANFGAGSAFDDETYTGGTSTTDGLMTWGSRHGLGG